MLGSESKISQRIYGYVWTWLRCVSAWVFTHILCWAFSFAHLCSFCSLWIKLTFAVKNLIVEDISKLWFSSSPKSEWPASMHAFGLRILVGSAQLQMALCLHIFCSCPFSVKLRVVLICLAPLVLLNARVLLWNLRCAPVWVGTCSWHLLTWTAFTCFLEPSLMTCPGWYVHSTSGQP